MSSNSRWAASPNPTPIPSRPYRPPAQSEADDSFLWLSTSFTTEGHAANPLDAVEDFSREFGGGGGAHNNTSGGVDSSLRTTFGGKVSRSGYQKMASTTSPSHRSAEQSTSSNNASESAGASTNPQDSRYRSSWNSTDSDGNSDNNSITQSDFEFLTPSFIAIDDGSGMGQGPAQDGRRRGAAKGGGLSIPGSNRVTGDSHTLGRLHNLDRESSILPPASVRSGRVGNSNENLDVIVEKVVAPKNEDGSRSGLPSSSNLVSAQPTTPTQPLKVFRKPSPRTQDRELLIPAQVQSSPSPSSAPVQQQKQRPSQPQQRYYHQPPPRQEHNQQSQQQQQQHRHARSTGSQDTTNTNSSQVSSRPAAAKSHASPTYPPTSFHSNHAHAQQHSKSGSYSANSGAGSPTTSVPSPISPSGLSIGSSLPSSITELLAARKRGVHHHNHNYNASASASAGPESVTAAVPHPYASSSAYRMAVMDYDVDEDGGGGVGSGYGLSSEREQNHPYHQQQHPFAHQPQYSTDRTPQPQQQRYQGFTEREQGGYRTVGSESGHGHGNGYSGSMGTLSPPSRASPKLSPTSSSNHGRGLPGDISEVHRDEKKQDWTAGGGGFGRSSNNKPDKTPAKNDFGGLKTSKKEKRQSAATLLSLRIRNIYPASPSSPKPPSKTQSSTSEGGGKHGFRDPPRSPMEGKNIDLWILKKCGIILAVVLIVGIVPALGTGYVAIGHAILRAKADSDQKPSSTNAAPLNAASESAFQQASIGSSAKAGAVGGAILALPVLLVVFIAIGPSGVADVKKALLKALSPSGQGSGLSQEEDMEEEKQKRLAAERRRSRRASSLWGPTAASVSFKEQSAAVLAMNVAVNVFLAFMFLCLGAGCAALGVLILAPSASAVSADEQVFLSTSTAALAGLVGGAVLFGGLVIVGGMLAWVVYEGGKPVALADQQLASGSMPVQGVNVGLRSVGAATTLNGSSFGQMTSGNGTFVSGQQTESGGVGAARP